MAFWRREGWEAPTLLPLPPTQHPGGGERVGGRAGTLHPRWLLMLGRGGGTPEPHGDHGGGIVQLPLVRSQAGGEEEASLRAGEGPSTNWGLLVESKALRSDLVWVLGGGIPLLYHSETQLRLQARSRASLGGSPQVQHPHTPPSHRQCPAIPHFQYSLPAPLSKGSTPCRTLASSTDPQP